MYERGGVFRSDNVDAQVDLGLTSFSTIKGHFHVTTVKLRFSLPLFIVSIFCVLYNFCFPFRFLSYVFVCIVCIPLCSPTLEENKISIYLSIFNNIRLIILRKGQQEVSLITEQK